MSTVTIVTMSLILGFVWGGFLVILVTAVVKERRKQRDEAAGAS